MARYSYGPQVQARIKRLFATLLTHAETTAYQGDSTITIRRPNDNPYHLIIKTKRHFLDTLPQKYDQEALKPAEVRNALKHYFKEYLGILVDHRTETQGSEEWHFTLKLWSPDISTNLQRFDEVWNANRSSKSKQYLTDQITSKSSKTTPKAAVTNLSIRIAIIYKRNVEPDASLAIHLHTALSHQQNVFIDQNLTIGVPWAEKLATEIRQSDFVIALLSEQAVSSEMLHQEIGLAYQTAQQNPGKAQLLPIRINYPHPYPYPLSTYLNHIQWASWKSSQDTSKLLAELETAISGGFLPIATQPHAASLPASELLLSPPPTAQPLLDLPDGTMEVSSPFYIERSSDRIALETIQQQGKTISIKGPRQVGKSSLLNRIAQTATSLDKQVVFIDFQEFERDILKDENVFYKYFCSYLTDELNLEDKTNEYWDPKFSNQRCCTKYISQYLLKQLNQALALVMDEVERMFDTPFRDNFFGLLRSWHNARARSFLWKKCDLVLSTSTEPYELIADLNQSPFNVGTVLALKDFNVDQVHQLNQQYGSPLNVTEEQQLVDLTHGHPFLTQRALYWVASKKVTAAELFDQAVSDNEPFGSHLKHHLFRIHNKPEQVAGLLEVFDKHKCSDRGVYHLLQGAGLVREERTNIVVPRCQLYKAYLGSRLRS